jgi:hypothetical protein
MGVALVASLFAYDAVQFRRGGTQRAFLASYVPAARCDGATFKVLEREDSFQDWRYVVSISSSDECARSLKEAVVAMGSLPATPEMVEQGLLLPAHRDTDSELVAFNFDVTPGTVIWTRDKT